MPAGTENKKEQIMTVARHPRPAELEDKSIEEIADRFTRRFRDITPDWEAFEDAKIEGF